MEKSIATIRTGPSVWQGNELLDDRSWIIPWSESDIAEIECALQVAQKNHDDWRDLARDDFPLPTVAAKLARATIDLEDGLGVVKLTELPIENYTLTELQFIWMGLGVHLGQPRFQDRNGQLMREIRDEGEGVGARHGQYDSSGNNFLSSTARTYSNGELRFHTDRVDVVGLLSVRQARTGGSSKIASTQAVHNALLERRPDLLALLYQNIYRSRLGEELGGEEMVYPLPVFAVCDGKFTSHFSRTFIEAGQLLPGTPRMTDEQWQALDLLASVSEELCYQMTLDPGEIQLLNNHIIYHARDAFEDVQGEERFLLRLWLSMPNSRALPEDHRILWENIEAGAVRGGIAQN